MRLSIVTVCFNAENCIDKTIQSVLNQTQPVYEYIVVDGASKDNTYEHVCSYDGEFRSREIVYKHISEKDRGISDAFNKGISMATGDIIGLINADDALLPETCSILQKKSNEVKSDIYFGNCIWVDFANDLRYVAKPKYDKLDKLTYYMVLIHPSTFVRKSAYDECGVFDITYKYCMDKELLCRMYKAGKKFFYIDEPLAEFSAGGVSDTHVKEVIREGSRMALQNGEPLIKVKLIEYKKLAKDSLSRLAKKTSVYKIIKKNHKV